MTPMCKEGMTKMGCMSKAPPPRPCAKAASGATLGPASARCKRCPPGRSSRPDYRSRLPLQDLSGCVGVKIARDGLERTRGPSRCFFGVAISRPPRFGSRRSAAETPKSAPYSADAPSRLGLRHDNHGRLPDRPAARHQGRRSHATLRRSKRPATTSKRRCASAIRSRGARCGTGCARSPPRKTPSRRSATFASC